MFKRLVWFVVSGIFWALVGWRLGRGLTRSTFAQRPVAFRASQWEIRGDGSATLRTAGMLGGEVPDLPVSRRVYLETELGDVLPGIVARVEPGAGPVVAVGSPLPRRPCLVADDFYYQV